MDVSVTGASGGVDLEDSLLSVYLKGRSIPTIRIHVPALDGVYWRTEMCVFSAHIYMEAVYGGGLCC